jgi:DNA-binding transcriptional MerR regulator
MARGDLKLVDGERNAGGEGAAEADLTVEQLAAATGMTVRNIRSHQARGLLPPPEVRHRVGYYGREHVARLKLIRELQSEGFNLRGIKRLLEETRGPAEQLLDLKHVVTAPFETEEAQVYTQEELAERFEGDADGRNIDKAIRLKLLVPLGGGRFEAPSPALLDAAEEVMRRGVTLSAALSVVEDVQRSCESVARRFVRLFLDDVWKPFEQAGYPEDQFESVVEAIERLRPIASQALLAVFQQTMTREVEAGFGKELRRLSEKRR